MCMREWVELASRLTDVAVLARSGKDHFMFDQKRRVMLQRKAKYIYIYFLTTYSTKSQ